MTVLTERKVFPEHPGRVLYEKWLAPAGIPVTRIGLDLYLAPTRMQGIVNGTRSITAETAVRLARFFGNSPEYWMGLQSAYEIGQYEKEHGDRVRMEVRPRASSAYYTFPTPAPRAAEEESPQEATDNDFLTVAEFPLPATKKRGRPRKVESPPDEDQHP